MTVSTVLVFIVAIFLLCHSLKICLNVYELSVTLQGLLNIGYQEIKTQNVAGKDIKAELEKDSVFRILSNISNVLVVFNSSINFLIYLVKDTK